MEIEKELRDKLKQQRLEQYKAQLFSLEMDLTAYEAIGETQKTEEARKAIEQGKAAYKAVEAM